MFMSFYAPHRTYILQLRRTIRVPLQRVNRAWEDPEDRLNWFAGNSTIEPTVGGTFTADNGAMAVFTEVVPSERWRMDWTSPQQKPGSTLVIEFTKNGKYETIVQVRHWRIKSKKDYEELYKGWLFMLDSLEAYLEKGVSLTYATWLEQKFTKS